MRLSPATSPPYPRLRVWSHSRDPVGHHLSGLNLVPNRGAPSFYLPGCFTRRESQVALDFDPLRVSCNSSSVPTNGNLQFPFWSRRPLSSLVIFYGSRGEHGLPILGRKMATTILWSFAFRWDIVTDYAAGLSIQGGNLTTRSPWLSVPG